MTRAHEADRVNQLQLEAEPKDVGFDADRLARIDRHFSRYVDDGRLPGWLIAISRDGRLAHVSSYGQRDIEAHEPLTTDTLFRIYSMTKPITSVAAMMLYEEGAFELTDPVASLIPSFADQRVFTGGSSLAPTSSHADEPMRVWHLLSHTSGLTYAQNHSHPVDAIYRAEGLDNSTPFPGDLSQFCDRLGHVPLMFEPGSSWNYSVSTDVLGRVVEVASGMALDKFLSRRIFEPLGMSDTSFGAPSSKLDRLAALYGVDQGTGKATRDEHGEAACHQPSFLSGGGGLVSSAYDYHRFTQMLLRGGELDGVRLLSSRTVHYMAENHLPGGMDLEQIGQRSFSETRYDGVGFGLGFSVVVDPVKYKVLSSRGEFAWGGAASTAFWVDPQEHITVLFFTQLRPSSAHPIRTQLKQLVYQALVD